MDNRFAVSSLSALAQETRLAAFRFLLSRTPAPANAGEVARRCRVPHNTMSTHLAILERARLISSERQGREVLYRADLDGFRSLLGFLANDCCGGRPEVCGPVLGEIVGIRGLKAALENRRG